MLIRSRSTLGAFVRSRLGVKGPSDILLQADGVGDALMSISSTEIIVSPFAAFWRFRTDNPYGTMQSISSAVNISGVNTQFAGKRENLSRGLERGRIGLSFNMPDLTGLTYAYLSVEFLNWQNAIETFVPEIWASFTDDSIITSSWFFNTNRLCGDGAYGVVGSQRINFQPGAITPRTLAVLSLVVGNNKELGGFGVGSTSVNGQQAAFTINLASCALVLGF